MSFRVDPWLGTIIIIHHQQECMQLVRIFPSATQDASSETFITSRPRLLCCVIMKTIRHLETGVFRQQLGVCSSLVEGEWDTNSTKYPQTAGLLEQDAFYIIP